jgi:hypothetical protein
MPINNLNPEDLGQFIGSEQWYRHSLVRSITYTDGAKCVADNGGAYWLLDEIALAQKFSAAVKPELFQFGS